MPQGRRLPLREGQHLARSRPGACSKVFLRDWFRLFGNARRLALRFGLRCSVASCPLTCGSRLVLVTVCVPHALSRQGSAVRRVAFSKNRSCRCFATRGERCFVVELKLQLSQTVTNRNNAIHSPSTQTAGSKDRDKSYESDVGVGVGGGWVGGTSVKVPGKRGKDRSQVDEERNRNLGG